MTTWIKLPRYILPFGVRTGQPSRWEVQVSYDHTRFPGCYGFAEHDEQGEGPGLWFERVGNSQQFTLTDYDGMATLPKSIIETLRAAGFVVDADFE